MSNTPSLLPCPFCAGGETHIHVNKGTWNGRGYGAPVSVEVRHWCESEQGQPSRMISRAGRDEASAIAAWNRRTPQPVVREPLTDEQLWANDEIMSLNADLGWHMDTIRMFTRVIERAHGIKGGQHGADN